ncbi:TonB-dependent receptor [Hymenobacter terrenus]|uniref:TonB-dependent receptor n=1 Tax=Hymenobacter terrenus TaxID=1629124 RepID=UPI0006196C11|nr:carboxypeptidase-like regulatory domain-containing protein [Hymenobacter terrenus]
MKKNYLLAASVAGLLAGHTVRAQSAFNITGTVHTDIGDPLPGATVLLKGSYVGAGTNSEGQFILVAPPTTKSEQVLSVSYAGFETLEVALPEGPNTPLDITLVPALAPLTQVVSAASRVEERILQAPVTVERLGTEPVLRLPVPDLERSLSLLKGIDVSSTGLLSTSLSTRGFNSPTSERLIQLTDYYDTQLPSLSTSIGNLLLGLPELDVESVEVLQGPASALYGANAFNGVVQLASQDPFTRQGLTVRLRGGTRSLLDGQLRFAQKLSERIAFKVVGSYVVGREFEVNNYEPTNSQINLVNNPAGSVLGYEAVNRYGSAFLTLSPAVAAAIPSGVNRELYGKTIYQTGFTEEQLLADDTRARTYRVLPTLSYLLTSQVKLTLGANLSWADGNYQSSSSRYRLQNFAAQQYRAELASQKWFVRASTTRDAGNDSYNLNFLGNYLQNIPAVGSPIPGLTYNRAYIGTFINTYGRLRDSRNPQMLPPDMALQAAAQAARSTELEPGSPTFNELRQQVIANAAPGQGARFNPSSLRHDLTTQYTLPLSRHTDLVVGGAYRQYRLGSPDNNLFAETDARRIVNYEYGGYGQLIQRLLPQERLKLAAAVRVDDFRNFKPAVSPRLSAVYSLGGKLEHNFRVSYGRAFRSPTQLDQYAYLEQGTVLQLGNIGNGYRGFLADFTRPTPAGTPTLIPVSFDALRPEQVSTYEVGYKGVIANKLFVDLNYYRSYYNDFIGTRRLISNVDGTAPSEDQLSTLNLAVPGAGQFTRIVQIQTNADQEVRTQGVTGGLSYSLVPALTISGNYSLSLLDRSNLPDDFQSFYNTPRHKFNVGANGAVTRRFSYALNYRWAEGHLYETPFAVGNLPEYSSFDAYLGYNVARLGTTIQVGGTNLFDAANTQVYGGPQIGRIVYAGLLVDIK